MLALTRKLNEAIIINDNIEIKVLEISGDKVRLGISAPKEMSIYREEIYNQVKESNQDATTVTKDNLKSLKDILKKK
ncbi:MAG: carbon storage regulator CsrA [Cellulosilyticaceae bacterium]